ncbi:hypothetical protein KFZ56_17870 [Virgibacillus sp. NKC19-3]|uniref:hypothetical protein n=1 Tax=Virgibacillus saliphilus TaxID=2831674 RepID=UPI001C9B78C7|nr:hypothetical protein [Virgibacillus sp. NKC19-3]MBY7144887.1 hypothetical protein [Virgibacillus sp. NKC19-3]
MKTFVLTTASALLLTSGGIGYAAHANPDTAPVAENNAAMNNHTHAEDVDDLVEYDILDDVADADNFNAQIVENNNNKRIILLKDDNDQPRFKSIYGKDTSRLKVIDFNGGLVFNQMIDDTEEEVDVDEDIAENEGNANEAVEENDRDSDAAESKTELEGLEEYATLSNYVDVDDGNAQVVEDNPHKRILLLKDGNDQPQFKSIYMKHPHRLKVIELDRGPIYNGSIQ